MDHAIGFALPPKAYLKTCLYDNGVLDIRKMIRNGSNDQAIKESLLRAFSNRVKDGFEAEATRVHTSHRVDVRDRRVTYSPIQTLIHSFTHSLTHSFLHSFNPKHRKAGSKIQAFPNPGKWVSP